MGLSRGLVFLLLLLLLYQLQGSDSSLMKLNGNGYEDVIVAIDPAMPEDEAIIEGIQEMVTAASTYMFEATEKRFYLKNVSILIPESWGNKPQYRRPGQESYAHADVKVAPPAVPGIDEPYTRQFTACGERGEYIHFTPDVVLGKKEAEYGPKGRLFVHEWAHLRWGVFDEYNEEKPYYAASSKKIEATRCTLGITGVNQVRKCQGDSCTSRSCRTNSTTKLYERDCQFFLDKDQSEKASIMYMQSIESVTEFCKDENHNKEAPSLHNEKCNQRSTWDVISSSEDFIDNVPMDTPPSPPTFSLLKIHERITCLVLDVSGSMTISDRLNRLKQAAQYFLIQIIEDGSWVGMVHFNSQATTKSEMMQINSEADRTKLRELLPSSARGGTSICSGIRRAFEVFKNEGFQNNGADIVLLSDGEDSTAKQCVDEVKESGSVLHFIALGEDYEEAVRNMSILTGGLFKGPSDAAQNNGLMDAFGALTSENSDVTQKSIQLESKGDTLNNNHWLNDTVVIDSTVGNNTLFLVTWKNAVPGISLWDPKGTQVTNFTMDTGSKMAHLSIPGIAQAGTWTYNLEAKSNQEILTITVSSRAASSSVPPITVNAKMNRDTGSFPSPMIVYAEVLQGYTPIIGAHVTAIIESNSGNIKELELLDNGAGADTFKDDGVYSRYFTAYSENGKYSLKVRADGGTNSARKSLRHPSRRAAYIPGWVVNGKIEGNPPRPETTEATQPVLENFSRAASGGAFVVSDVPTNLPGPLPDMYPPSQITDLQATLDGEDISLTWTAPGEDFDTGKAQQYIIRISENITDLRDNFDEALQVNTTDLLPNEANSKETFVFKPENISEENATYIFIAMKSVDKSNLSSELSNIAQVILFIPQADAGPDSPGSPDISVSTIVLSVVGSVAVVCIILSATVCVLKKRRSSSNAETSF
ncbi:calcium-activated chloride channel regulator 4A-like isoform X2 [Arvicola amphibius]|uniref:calcium-activated chloride channel regulator 4A-like isoform X2 n=1 Tax=Arvicola amphibius TaxID=1047088 RepID=UPI0018E33C2F|nr:calcium-activated chloride channel regulator 4A-like isoform X2 [Arvicola amphibius]